MIKRFLACIFIIAGIGNQFLFAQNETDVINYIDKYKKFAIEEQLRTGVPASITLAQGIHETSAGNSELASEANNHFGIKCKSNWTGETFLHDDDKKQECFRKYPNAQQSYIDHSDFLRGSSRYQSLFEMEITDYVGWATGLKKAGYATNPAYVKRLTDLVEKYNLQQYTYEALSLASKKPGEVVPERDAKNPDIIDDPNTNYKGLRGFWAKKGDLLPEKAVQYDIKYAKLLDMNDLQDEPLPFDMFVLLEKKKRMGTVEFHMVKEEENMLLISQKEAINLSNLYAFNNMKKGDEPLPGEQLSLQYRSYGKPKLIQKDEPVQEVRIVEPEIKTTATTATRPPNTEVQTATAADIIDVEKAKKVEAILTGEKEGKSEIQVTQQDIQAQSTAKPKTEATAKTEAASKAEPVAKAEPEKKIEKKPLPVMPKRTYNETGVDDSVKILKERFDNLVYRPFERRVSAVQVKEVSKTETVVVKSNSTGITKETVVKKENKKPATTDPKAVVAEKDAKAMTKPAATEEIKNTNVEKTKTGVVRDVKKIEEEKKKALEAQAAAKADAKKGNTKGNQSDKKESKDVLQKGSKTTVKKVADKKETATSKTKKNDTKKEDSKKAANKKSDAPKPAVKKKDPKKK